MAYVPSEQSRLARAAYEAPRIVRRPTQAAISGRAVRLCAIGFCIAFWAGAAWMIHGLL